MLHLDLRKLRWGTMALASMLALGAVDARAVTVSFGDSIRYWDGYANGTSDDSRDTIGTPDLRGGTATFDTMGRLTNVSITYTGHFSLVASGNGRVIPGDLFLDLGGDGSWDYVMKLVDGAQTPVASYASLSILQVGGVDTSPSYLMTGSDDTGHWRGYGIRDGHPYAWNGGGEEIGIGSMSGYNATADGGTLSFDLGLGIVVRDSVRISFAPSCANDVIVGDVTAPVPEPTAALVFGIGLAVVTRAARKPRS
jgi:hypothetical protein